MAKDTTKTSGKDAGADKDDAADQATVDAATDKVSAMVAGDQPPAPDLVKPGDAPQADAPKTLRTDGPTIKEFARAGYPIENYPPNGYAAVSSDADIQAAKNLKASNADAFSEWLKADDAPGPVPGTRAAADAFLSTMQPVPGGHKDAKILDRPLTSGANG